MEKGENGGTRCSFRKSGYSYLGKTPIEMDGKLRKERWPVYPDHEH